MNHHREPDLLRSIAGGDEAAFGELFASYWPLVYNISLRLCKSPELAKDLAQDIFVKLWTHRGRLPGVRNLDAFIYTVSRNLIFNHFQKKVLDISRIDLLVEHFSYNALGAQERLEYKDLEDNIQIAIDRLPGRVKEVFVLHRFEGLNHDQISQKLNISVVSSKTYIVRALKDIRAYLSHHSKEVIPIFLLFLEKYLR